MKTLEKKYEQAVSEYLQTHDVYTPKPLGYDLSKVVLLKEKYNSISEIPKELIENCATDTIIKEGSQ